MYSSIFEFILDKLQNKKILKDGVMRCGLGTNSVAIGWNGKLYGCQQDVTIQEKTIMQIGDLTNGINIKSHTKLLKSYIKLPPSDPLHYASIEFFTNLFIEFTKVFPELTYELSDNNNERKVIKRSELQYLASSNQYQIQGYPRRTIITDISPRNMRCFIQKQCETTPLTEQVHQVQFYYKKDTNIIKPLIFERSEDNG